VQARRFLLPRVPRFQFTAQRSAARRAVAYLTATAQVGRTQLALYSVRGKMALLQQAWRAAAGVRAARRNIVMAQLDKFELRMMNANKRRCANVHVLDFMRITVVTWMVDVHEPCVVRQAYTSSKLEVIMDWTLSKVRSYAPARACTQGGDPQGGRKAPAGRGPCWCALRA
jgi:hypothetical protein